MNLINASKFIHCDPNELVRVTNSVNRLMAESNDFDYINSVLNEAFSGDLLEYALDLVSEATAMAKRGKDEVAIRTKIASNTSGGEAADRATALEKKPTYGANNISRQRSQYARTQRRDFRDTASSNPGLHGYSYQSNDPTVKAKQIARSKQRAALTPDERKQLNMGESKKIKGIDGKACWKGYKYAGTKNGKDKCVKAESVITEEKSSYMGVEIVFNGKSFSAPSLAIYNIASKPQIKIKIKEKILKRNELQNKMRNPGSTKKEHLDYNKMDMINELHVYSLEEGIVENNDEFFEVLNLMTEEEFFTLYEKMKKDTSDCENDKPSSKYSQNLVGKKKGSVIIHPRIKSTANVYESLINEVDVTTRSPDCGNEIVTCANKPTKKSSKKTLFKKEKTMRTEEYNYDELAELVAEHLLEQGLNEYGVDMFIEELGVEDFCGYVDDLLEDYELLEWRRGPGGTKVRGSGTSKSGKAIFQLKGGAKSAAIRATPEHKARKAERENEGSKDSKMRDSLRSQSKIAKAKVSQPETKSTPVQTKEKAKGGVLGAIKARAQRDTALLRKSVDTARNVGARRAAEVKATYDAIRSRGKEVESRPDVVRARRKATVAAGRAAQAAGRTAVKAAGAAGAAAGEAVKARRSGKSGAATAGRAVGTFIRKMRSEDFEFLANYLMQYESLTEDQAFDLIEEFDDEELQYMYERACITENLNESFSEFMEIKKKKINEGNDRSLSQAEIERLAQIKRFHGRRARNGVYRTLTSKKVRNDPKARQRTLDTVDTSSAETGLRKGEVKKWDSTKNRYVSNLE